MNAELFDTLATATVAGSLAVLGVLLLRVAVRRRFGAGIAYALWALVPLATFASLLPAPATPLTAVLSIVRDTGAMMRPQATSVIYDWRPFALCLWLFGAGALGMLRIVQQRRYLRRLGRLRGIGGARAATVVKAASVDGSPALVGALRPRIVLPADFAARYVPSERALILAHERTHLVRGDAQINAFAALLGCLNWFNPLIHLALARFRLDQELACDAAVIARFPEARRRYADAMLKTQLAGQRRQELPLPVGCRWPSCHPLKERIAMLKRPLPSRATRWSGVALVGLLGLGGAFVTWAAQSPQTAPAAAANGASLPSYRRLKPPVYPEQLKGTHAAATIYLKVAVDAEGKVTAAAVDHALPADAPKALVDSALAAVKAWTFNPASKDGKPMTAAVIVPIRFGDGPSPKSGAVDQPGTLETIYLRDPAS